MWIYEVLVAVALFVIQGASWIHAWVSEHFLRD